MELSRHLGTLNLLVLLIILETRFWLDTGWNPAPSPRLIQSVVADSYLVIDGLKSLAASL
jgi:hypothetical protein